MNFEQWLKKQGFLLSEDDLLGAIAAEAARQGWLGAMENVGATLLAVRMGLDVAIDETERAA